MDGLVNVPAPPRSGRGPELRRLQTGRAQDYLYGVTAGLLLCCRSGGSGVTALPVLSLVTAIPFVAACLIMLVGRTRPTRCG